MNAAGFRASISTWPPRPRRDVRLERHALCCIHPVAERGGTVEREPVDDSANDDAASHELNSRLSSGRSVLREMLNSLHSGAILSRPAAER